MKFICDKCSAKYSIADEKIRKKVLKIRCKKCSHVIIVRDPQSRSVQNATQANTAAVTQPNAAAATRARAQSPSTQASPVASRPAFEASSSPFTAQAIPPSAHDFLQPNEPPQKEERTVIARISTDWIRQVRKEKQEEPIWFFALFGQPKGPVVLSEVVQHIQDGDVKKDTLVWCGGWPEWVPAGKVSELKEAFLPAPIGPPTLQTPPKNFFAEAASKASSPAAPAPTATAPKAAAPAPSPLSQPAQPAQPLQTAATLSQPVQPAQPLQTAATLSQPVQPSQPAQPLQTAATLSQPVQPAQSFGSPIAALSHSSTAPSVQSPLSASPQPAQPLQPAQPAQPLQPAQPARAMEPVVESPLRPNGSGSFSQAFGAGSPASQLTPSSPSPGLEDSPLGVHIEPPTENLPGLFSPAESTPHTQDIAHEQQARPVEFIESVAEEDFFSQKSSGLMIGSEDSDVDSLDIVLPPMPYMEEEESLEFDIDDADIIEIRETLKPKYPARIAVFGGLSLLIAIFVVPLMMDSQKKKQPNKVSSSFQQSIRSKKKVKIKLSAQERKARMALLQRMGNKNPKGNPSAALRPTKRTTKRRRRYKKRRRKVRIAIKTNSKGKSIDDLIKARLAARLKKVGINDGSSGKSPTGKLSSSSNISKKLVRRLYKELIAKNRGIQYCYNLHLKSGYFGGRLLLSLRIIPSGRVTQVRVSPSKFKGIKFTKCLLREIKYKWRFTSFSGEAVWLESPYSLSAQ